MTYPCQLNNDGLQNRKHFCITKYRWTPRVVSQDCVEESRNERFRHGQVLHGDSMFHDGTDETKYFSLRRPCIAKTGSLGRDLPYEAKMRL